MMKINRYYLIENELKISKEEKRVFLESIKQLQHFKHEIYRSGKLKEISQKISNLIEIANNITLSETSDGWFDNITVSRDMKRLKESQKVFEKTAKEITTLQQRLESAYEDIATGLSRYYEV